MKLAIYGDTPKAEQLLILKLEQNGTSVTLVAVNASGITHSGGYILDINEFGTVHLRSDINSDLGLSLGASGRINTS